MGTDKTTEIALARSATTRLGGPKWIKGAVRFTPNLHPNRAPGKARHACPRPRL